MTTRLKVHIHLGTHENPYAGMFQYGRALIQGINESGRADLSATVITKDVRVKEELKDCRDLTVLPYGSFRQFSVVNEPFLRKIPNTGAPTILHGVSNMVPLRGDFKRVLTLHDLIQALPIERFSSTSRKLYVETRSCLYKSLFKLYAKRVDRVITIHPTQKGLIEEYLQPSHPVTVAYTPLPAEFLGALPKNVERKPRSITLMASKDLRKNIPLAAKALSATRDEINEITLVLANRSLEEWARSLDWPEGIKLNIAIEPSHNQLAQILAGSEALFFPSVAEGLGLPIFQALMMGTKVVCAKKFLVPEVQSLEKIATADVDPDSLDSLSSGVRKIFTLSPKDEDYEISRQKIRENFSGESLARKVLSVYEELM